MKDIWDYMQLRTVSRLPSSAVEYRARDVLSRGVLKLLRYGVKPGKKHKVYIDKHGILYVPSLDEVQFFSWKLKMP
jgi:hypothetical protein